MRIDHIWRNKLAAEWAAVLLLNFKNQPTFLKQNNPKHPDKEIKFKPLNYPQN